MRSHEKCRNALAIHLALFLFSCFTRVHVVALPGGCFSCVDPAGQDRPISYYPIEPSSDGGSSGRHIMPPGASPVHVSSEASLATIGGSSFTSTAGSTKPLGHVEKSGNYIIYCDKASARVVRNALQEAHDAIAAAGTELASDKPGNGYDKIFGPIAPHIINVAFNRAAQGYPIVSKVHGNPQALPPRIVCAEEHMEVVYGVSQSFNDACNAHPAAPAFYPLDTPFVIICKPFFQLKPRPTENHCPAWDKDSQHFRPGQQTALTTLYQNYVLIQKLVHAYLDNPLSAGTPTAETYDWDEMLLLKPADKLNNPPSYDFWAAREYCSPWCHLCGGLVDFLPSAPAELRVGLGLASKNWSKVIWKTDDMIT